MNSLITYDIAEGRLQESKHTEVKEAMKSKGYRQSFTFKGDETVHYLPNTSLWKPDTTTSQAKSDLQQVAKEKSADLERMVATEFSNVVAIPGKKYASK